MPKDGSALNSIANRYAAPAPAAAGGGIENDPAFQAMKALYQQAQAKPQQNLAAAEPVEHEPCVNCGKHPKIKHGLEGEDAGLSGAQQVEASMRKAFGP